MSNIFRYDLHAFEYDEAVGRLLLVNRRKNISNTKKNYILFCNYKKRISKVS